MTLNNVLFYKTENINRTDGLLISAQFVNSRGYF